MPAFYPESIKFPKTVKAIMESVIIYTAQILYPELYGLDPIEALKRVIISDLDAGNEFLLRTQTNYFESLNFKYPVTFYQYENREYKTNYNQLAARGTFYSFELKRNVYAFPNSMTIKMVTIYNHPDDYMRALTVLQNTNANLTRLYSATKFIDYQHNINKIMPIPFDLIWQVEKGSYTFKFQEYLKINKLYDVVHIANINFWDFMLTDYLENLEINNLILNMGELNSDTNTKKDISNEYINIAQKNININEPIYSSVINNSVIPSDTSKVLFYFMNPVNQLNIENSFTLYPYLSCSFEWNDESNILTVTFNDALSSNTNYEISFIYSFSSDKKIEKYFLYFKTK
jgi:hypothetical protein